MVLPPDGLWGDVKRNGTVTGLIGVVARREAHLAVADVTLTGKTGKRQIANLVMYPLNGRIAATMIYM